MTSEVHAPSGDSPATIELIRSVAENTRNIRLVEDFEVDPERVNEQVESGEMTDILLGRCHENAELLARHLYQNGIQPTIVWGALTTPGVDITVESVEQMETAMKGGYVHFWVEVPPSETDSTRPIIAEIAAEPDGGLRVTEELPDNYIRPPESRITYEPTTVTAKRLRSLRGYEYLKQEGLVQ